MPIEFLITITQADKAVAFECESEDSPEATKSEIEYAKAFMVMVSAFKEKLGNKKPGVQIMDKFPEPPGAGEPQSLN